MTTVTAFAASIDISSYWGSGATVHAYTISTPDTIDLTALSGTDANGLTLTVDSGASVIFSGDANAIYTKLSIVIASGATVTLDNVSIDNTGWNTAPVVAGDVNASNTLRFSGSNTLTAPSGCAAVYVGVYNYNPCSININGADGSSILNANGGENSAGIGSINGVATGTITITEGTVNAKGGYGGAGIGGGSLIPGGTVTITGGTVTAIGGSTAAGIGGGANRPGGIVTISGGTVEAKGGTYGTGIGGGAQGSGGTLVVTGGMVSAIGSDTGAGIGGGHFGSGGAVTISGGTVEAKGGAGGTGIGGGYNGTGGSVTIIGGTINATIQSTPTNGSQMVYLTTASLPSGTNVSALSVKQSGSVYSYGTTDMQVDSDKKIYLYLPANINTTADITMDGTDSYTGYYGTVAIGGANVLKMDQSSISITGVNASYHYGDTIAPAVSGGSGTGAVTYNYKSDDDTTDYGSVKPTDVGSYRVTAQKSGGASYYVTTASAVSFSIEQKDISTTCTVADIAVQTYTGSPITPAVTITDGIKTLIKDTDYTVSYGANTSAGTDAGSVTIAGIGNYIGSVTKNFTINKTSTSNGGSSSSGSSESTDYKISVDKKDTPGKLPYSDVQKSAWYYDSISYVSQKELMTGDGEHFNPDSKMTRAMVVTVLFRFGGASGSYGNNFTDITAGSWYEQSTAWATANGIASGVGNSKFAPESTVTREQLAVMLFNYAKYKGLDVSVGEDTDLLAYNDAQTSSDYARTALNWACGRGILQGDSKGNLNPRNSASRGEVAAMLQRFIEITGTKSMGMPR